MNARPVLLDPVAERDPGEVALLEQVAVEARRLAGAGVTAAIAWAPRLAAACPEPGAGATRLRLELLASVGAADLTVARVAEPHLDAVAILREAEAAAPHGATLGVYAAEGPDGRVTARQSPDGGWLLEGRKPWCSLADRLSHALVTAWLDGSRRGLFLLDLRDPAVRATPGTWCPSGLAAVTSTGVELEDAPAEAVGGPQWYLHRPGFAWGGIGVAAVWFGGAVEVARRLLAQARRREPDQMALMHLGAADTALHGARAALVQAALAVDVGDPRPALLAARVRSVVASAAEQVLATAAHALGPGPLVQEPEHARRVDDLALYVRQHHAERDLAATGRLLVEEESEPW